MYTPVCILTRNAKACAMKTKIGLLTSIYISFTFVNKFIIKVTGLKKKQVNDFVCYILQIYLL